MHTATLHPAKFQRDGVAICPDVLDAAQLASARMEAERLAISRRASAGIRDPIGLSETLCSIAASERVAQLCQTHLGRRARLVRSILFDKTPDANWDVVWHQDVTIAVRERIDLPGFGPWSVKLGVPHVQPPAEVLQQMLTVRIHLDDCDASNGPLLVVPRSHQRGVLDVRTLDVAACDRDSVACTCAAGDAVIMKPLTLHASRKADSPSHRRVLHLEFANDELPGGLRWA